MTVWRVGMLAVCLKGETGTGWFTDNDERPIIYPVPGEVYKVVETGSDGDVNWLCFAEFPAEYAFDQVEFRPAVTDDQADDTALIARIKNCTPQRVVAHE